MFIRPCYRQKNGKNHVCWALVESYRTERGPRQRVVSYPGLLKESERLGIKQAARGNKNDVKTWQDIVTKMEAYYGKANRIWCGDHGMMSKENIDFMQSGNRKYIIGASKSTLKKFERQLLQDDWQTIREGLEVVTVHTFFRLLSFALSGRKKNAWVKAPLYKTGFHTEDYTGALL